jgi:ribosome-binding ATPase YchF (GTP1/OBG family)
MKAGIVGLPNVGNQHYLIVWMQSAKRQFSFCTIEPNIGVNVPDSRIEN